MSLKTKLLELFKYEPDKDGAQTFNIKSALNDNWDKIEAWAQSVKTALTKLVPTSRTVNGKTLAEDVTLTAADIKMPDSEEDVGAAMAKRLINYGTEFASKDTILDAVMAKRPLKQYPKTLDVHKITIGQLYWCDEDTANTPYKAGLTGYAQGVALCTAGSAEEKWCSIIYIVHAGKGVWFQSRNQDGWTNWVQLAKCETPEIHELPLADSINRLGTAAYWKNAFNEVTVVFDYGEKSNDNFIPDQWTLIATLPEGFRPVLQSQWGMCSDSGSDNVVATYRLDYDGSLYYRASTAAVNKKSLGGIRFVFIARN